jgi:hypothetical protein
MKKYIQAGVMLLISSVILLSGCNLPAFAPPAVVDSGPVVLVVTATAQPAPACEPTITAVSNANVRTGPDIIYNVVGQLPQGGTAKVVGRNDTFTWYYIVFPGGPGGYAWIAGSVSSATCLPAVLQVVAAPPASVAQEPQQPQQNEPEPEEPDPGDPPSGPVGPVFELDPGFFFPLLIWTPTPTPFPFFPDLDLDLDPFDLGF